MLNISEFRSFRGSRPSFPFQKLMQVDQEQGIYHCTETHRRYHVAILDPHHANELYALHQ